MPLDALEQLTNIFNLRREDDTVMLSADPFPDDLEAPEVDLIEG